MEPTGAVLGAKLRGRPVRGTVALCRNVGIRWRRALGTTSGTLVVGQYEVGDARRDLGAETRTVEHAVMTDILLHPMRLTVGRDVHAQPMRRLSLAQAGNIVVLT